jgi:membrane peptidoglycan carboxypeptidase
VARGVTAVLREVVQRGTATRAAIDRPAAAKTGTSTAWRDAWLAGYVPQLTAVVWVGNPIPIPGEGTESMTPGNGYPYRIVGGTLPAMLWHSFMTDATKDLPVRTFTDPPGLLFRPPLLAPDELLSPPPPGVGGMPSVVGKIHGIARLRLRRAGFAVSEVAECAPGDVNLHRVWNQDPPPGTPVEPGQSVTIWYQPAGCN